MYSLPCGPPIRHLRLAQHCFSLPCPPNFGLSRQYLHLPQSIQVHASQVPHRFLFIPLWLVEKWTRYLSACYLHALTMYKLYLCVVYWVHIYLVHCHRGLIPGNQHQKWLVWWRLRETTYRCEEIFQWHNDYPYTITSTMHGMQQH